MKNKALELARAGFYVFPVAAGAKSPPLVKFRETATRSSAEIEKLWEGRENANIGIWTEKYGFDQALIVVDVDVAKGGTETISKYDLPPTYRVNTPTGGYHLYYVVDDPVRQGVDVLGPGVDIRSMGGYVMAPGSVRPAGGYVAANRCAMAPAPRYLVSRLGRRKERATVSLAVDQGKARDEAVEYLKHRKAAVEGEGGDAHTYVTACAVRDFGCSEALCLELMLDWNEYCDPPWNLEDLRAKVAHAYKYAVELAGHKHPDVIAADFEAIEGSIPATGVSKRKLNWLPASEFSSPSEGKTYLIKGLLQRSSLGLMFGPPGVGKSFLAVDAALHVAMGRPWFGRKVKQCPVVYLAAEAGYDVQQRIRAWAGHYDVRMSDIPLAVIPEPVDMLNVKHCKDVEAVIKAVSEKFQGPVGLMLIDTMAVAFGDGDENTAKDCNTYTNHLNTLRAALDCAFLTIHHSGKDGARGARGSSALFAAMDTVLRVEQGKVWCEKQRAMAKFETPLNFGLWPIEIGVDEDNSSVTSCVVQVANMDGVLASVEKLGKYGKLAVESLSQAIRDDGQPAPDAFGLPPGHQTVSEAAWRKVFIEAYDGQESSAKKAFIRICDSLLKARTVGTLNDKYWLHPEVIYF